MAESGAIDAIGSADGVEDTAAAGAVAGDLPAGDEAPSGTETSAGKPPLRQRLLRPVVLALTAFVLSTLGIAAAALTSVPDDRGGARAVTGQLAGPLTHHQLPEMIADLKPSGRRTHFVQVIAVVELPEEAVPALAGQETAIVAEVQTRLRDRDRPMLIGKRGAEELRNEMISIVDACIAPHRVNTVLFTRFLLD